MGGLFWNRTDQSVDQTASFPPVLEDFSKTEQLRSWSEKFGAILRSIQFRPAQSLPRRTSLYNDSIMERGSFSSPASPSMRPRQLSRDTEEIENLLKGSIISPKARAARGAAPKTVTFEADDLFSIFEKKSRHVSTIMTNVTGITKAESGDMHGAAICFADAAAASLPSAMFNLGLCHQLGKGVPTNNGKVRLAPRIFKEI